MIHTMVGFVPTKDVAVCPSIVAGKPTSVWVTTRTRDHGEIEQSAKSKLLGCYGLDISSVDVYDGNQHREEA